MNMSKWNSALFSVSKHGIVGNCPSCGSTDTDYEYYKLKSGRGSLDIWCNSCNVRIHADCSLVPEGRKISNDCNTENLTGRM